jgi:hypothetical protein
VFGFVIGDTLQHQLHAVVLTLDISSMGANTTGLAHNQPSIFDGVVMAIRHHRIFPIDLRGHPIALPQQIPGDPFFCPLLRFVRPLSTRLFSTLERPRTRLHAPHPAGLSQVHTPVSAREVRLVRLSSQHGIHVVGVPGAVQAHGHVIEVRIPKDRIALAAPAPGSRG